MASRRVDKVNAASIDSNTFIGSIPDGPFRLFGGSPDLQVEVAFTLLRHTNEIVYQLYKLLLIPRQDVSVTLLKPNALKAHEESTFRKIIPLSLHAHTARSNIR